MIPMINGRFVNEQLTKNSSHLHIMVIYDVNGFTEMVKLLSFYLHNLVWFTKNHWGVLQVCFFFY